MNSFRTKFYTDNHRLYFVPDQIMQYVRNLEQRVKQLEDDKRTLTHKINQLAASSGDPNIAVPPDSSVGVLSGRPEAVVRALQVLEVREQLEREGRMPDRGENITAPAQGDMDDGEKALVREMCNVSKKKSIYIFCFNWGMNKIIFAKKKVESFNWLLDKPSYFVI